MTSLALLGALTPPAAQDALVHHLAVPKLFIEAGHWMELLYNYFSYFPAGMEMLFLYGLLVQGPGMATLLHWCFGLATFVAILEGGRVLGIGLRGRLIAGAAFLTVPTVWMEMTWAYVDLALTFYVTLTMLALLRFRQDPSRMSWLYLAGFALGGALSLKYTALVFLFILPPLVFLVLRETKRARGWKAAELSLAPIAIALAVSCPWFIRNIVWTGNPVFPFFVGLIPSNNPGWDAERSRILWTVLGRYGGEQKTLVDYVLVPLKLSFQASYESDRHYQGVVGAFYLLSLPLLLVVRRLAVPARYLLGFATCYYLFSLFSSQQVRYLLPVLPSLALAIASAGDLLPVNAQRRIREGLKRGTLALVSAIFLFNAAHLRIRSARAGTPAAIA
jgi:4-amino-4-deoxy-L-arabinose transferase-like glycosyltransferase